METEETAEGGDDRDGAQGKEGAGTAAVFERARMGRLRAAASSSGFERRL
jgi:hypothetical protein